MESGVEPLLRFFPPAISEHLGKLLDLRIEMVQVRMDLANLSERHSFFIREVDGAAQHHTHYATGCQCHGGCHSTNFDPLLFHPPQTQEKAFNRHTGAAIAASGHFAEQADSIALPFDPTRPQVGFIRSCLMSTI
jgi:hypothetical protein